MTAARAPMDPRGRKLPRVAAAAMAAAFVLGGAADASADSMRCGSRLVSTGDSKAKVLLRCGEPFHREPLGEKKSEEVGKTTVVEVAPGRVEVTEKEKTEATVKPVERWYYSFGRAHFIRILTFEGDELTEIVLGDKP